MRAVFVHDHIFKKNGEKYYSEGQLMNTTWQRYLKHVKELLVIGRSETINKDLITHYSLSSCDHVSFKCIQSIKLLDRLLTSRIDRHLESIIVDCDFIICRLPSFLGIRAFHVAKRLEKKVLIELVGCPYEALKYHGSLAGKVLAPIEQYKVKNVIKASDYTVYVTDHFLQERYPTNGFSIGISNVELHQSEFQYINKDFEEVDVFRIGFIGSLNAKYKGLKDLILAISKLRHRNIELHILGSGSKDCNTRLADDLGVINNLYFHKPIAAGAEVLKWLSHQDLYVQPSHTEGLPRALIEAMSVGLPCIGSRVGGIPELLSDSTLFEPKNYTELSQKIESFIKNKEFRQEQSELNKATSNNYYFDKLSVKRTEFLSEFFGK